MAITESRVLPPQFVEDLGKDYAAQLTGLTSRKLNTQDFQPMVAPQDQATKDAYTQATTQGQGIGAYAPYLQAAGQYQTGTGTFAGLPTNMMGAQDLVGPQAYQQFMSPYQQDVIDATLSEYDKQAAAGIYNDTVALHVVKETDAGIVVSGARLLATLGPFADEIEVFPSTVLKADPANIPFAFAFAITFEFTFIHVSIHQQPHAVEILEDRGDKERRCALGAGAHIGVCAWDSR